jgi:hypothetical protein
MTLAARVALSCRSARAGHRVTQDFCPPRATWSNNLAYAADETHLPTAGDLDEA